MIDIRQAQTLLICGLGALSIALFALWLKEFLKRSAQMARLAVYEEKLRKIPELEQALMHKEEEYLRLMKQQSGAEEKLLVLQAAQEKFSETLRALSLEALEKNNRSFLDLAQETLSKFQERAHGDLEKRQQSIAALVHPVKEALGKLDHDMRQLEKERKGEHSSLHAQMRSLNETEKQLRHETASLVKALRAPVTRGRWGEIQLKRVVELAGMLDHCDFHEQHYQMMDDIGVRPDLVIHLPGGRQVVVDAKAPLDAYLDSIQAQDDAVKEAKLKHHAKQVRTHVATLAKKSYWEQFQPAPEFVILFLPSDSFFSAALEHDPALIELGVERGVIVATPSTLIALLRTVAYGWKQESLSRHVEQVSLLGQDLYKRILDMSSHWVRMGKSLSASVDSYNKAVGSLEARVLVTARKFKELGPASAMEEITPMESVERIPRLLQAPEIPAET